MSLRKLGKFNFPSCIHLVRHCQFHHNIKCANLFANLIRTYINSICSFWKKWYNSLISLLHPHTPCTHTHTQTLWDSLISPLYASSTHQYAVPRVSRKHFPERPHWKMKPFWCTDFYIVRVYFIYLSTKYNQLKCLCVYICCTCSQCDHRYITTKIPIWKYTDLISLSEIACAANLTWLGKVRHRATNVRVDSLVWRKVVRKRIDSRKKHEGRNSHYFLKTVYSLTNNANAKDKVVMFSSQITSKNLYCVSTLEIYFVWSAHIQPDCGAK